MDPIYESNLDDVRLDNVSFFISTFDILFLARSSALYIFALAANKKEVFHKNAASTAAVWDL